MQFDQELENNITIVCNLILENRDKTAQEIAEYLEYENNPKYIAVIESLQDSLFDLYDENIKELPES